MSDQGWTAPGAGSGRPEQPPFPPAHQPQQQPPWQPPAQVPPTAYPGHPAYPPMRPAAPPRMDFRPGIIPLRPLTMNDIFGAVFRAVRGNVAATVGLAALTSLVFLVPFTALGAWVSSMEESVTLEESVNGDTAGLLGTLGSSIPSFASGWSAILLAGFLAYVIGQAVLGRKVSAGETWRGTIPRIWALIGATLLSLLIFAGVAVVILAIPIALIVAGATSGSDGSLAAGVGLVILAAFLLLAAYLFLWTRLAFVTSSLILENLGVGRAFARSWRLTGGQPFWRILGIRLLTAIAVGIAGSVVTAPLALAGGALVLTGLPLDQMYVWQAVLAGVSALIVGALTTPITAGVDAVMYVDQRIRREGLDVHLIQTAQGTAAPPWTSARA